MFLVDFQQCLSSVLKDIITPANLQKEFTEHVRSLSADFSAIFPFILGGMLMMVHGVNSFSDKFDTALLHKYLSVAVFLPTYMFV